MLARKVRFAHRVANVMNEDIWDWGLTEQRAMFSWKVQGMKPCLALSKTAPSSTADDHWIKCNLVPLCANLTFFMNLMFKIMHNIKKHE